MPTELSKDLLELLDESDREVVAGVVKRNPAFAERVVTGDEMVSEYAGAVVRRPAAVATSEDVSKLLTDFETRFDAKVSERVEKVKKELEEDMGKRGDQLYANTLRTADTLAQIRMNHKAEFAEDFKVTDLESFIEEQRKVGRQFPSVTDAYNEMVGARRTKAAIDKGIEEGIKTRRSGEQVAGVTEAGGTSSPVLAFKKREEQRKQGGGASTAVQKALEELSAKQAHAASA